MTLLETYRLPVRVPPLASESLRGYLMRAAAQNGLSGIDRLMTDVVGGARLPITPRRAQRLADYCRCDVTEFFQLFGIEYRSGDGSRRWQIADQWVTKDYLIRAGRPAICPTCLRSEAYLRGQWDLTFYAACSVHGLRLLEACPACRRPVSAHRARIDVCNCGHSFVSDETPPAPEEALWLASLVDLRVTNMVHRARWQTSRKVGRVVDRLALLDLDVLFKTIWFLGHCFAIREPLQTGHGRQKASVDSAEQIIRAAFDVLVDWPDSFLLGLERWLWRFDPDGRHHPESCLMPIHNYLARELAGAECAFISVAYERFLRGAWKSRNYVPTRQKVTQQMELF